jgi:hypothetical protein
VQLGARDNLGDETDLERPLRRHALVVAEQRQAHDLGEWHLLQHVDGLEGRRHPVGDVRVEEGGLGRTDRDVDLVHPVERATGDHPVQGGHHRLVDVLLLRAEEHAGVVRVERVGPEVVALLDVDAGAERPLPGRPQHHRPDVVIGSDPAPDLLELLAHQAVEGVHPLRSVQRHRGDAVANLEQHRFERVVLDHRRGNPRTLSASRSFTISVVPAAIVAARP